MIVLLDGECLAGSYVFVRNLKILLQMVIAAMKLKYVYSLEEKL